MKAHELALARAMLERDPDGPMPRDCIKRAGLVPKQCWRVLEKWCDKGWYDFGVCIDLGWLTEEGRAALQAAVEQEEGR